MNIDTYVPLQYTQLNIDTLVQYTQLNIDTEHLYILQYTQMNIDTLLHYTQLNMYTLVHFTLQTIEYTYRYSYTCPMLLIKYKYSLLLYSTLNWKYLQCRLLQYIQLNIDTLYSCTVTHNLIWIKVKFSYNIWHSD